MDLVTIASFISLEIASGFLKEHGKEIYHKAKGLLTPEEITTLDLLEKYPKSKELQGEIETALEKHLKANPEISEDFEKLLVKLKKTNPTKIINEVIVDSEIKNNLISNTERQGKAEIKNKDIIGSKIDNDMEIS
ncbi:MAG: hypothetical protein M3033_08130 [Acidobacteriota bacterium]|nr:hypothetical protein [Acidobacteriota bacterium]